MHNVKKIAIIGNAGSGKSTLALQLSKITHLSVYHLDQYFWGPNWTHPDYEAYSVIHSDLCDKDEWIIDGMNLRLLEYRVFCADMVIFLDIPRYVCFWRIFKRLFQYYGKETPSSASGCAERLNWNFVIFLKWVWNFKKRYPERIKWTLADYAGEKEIYVFKKQREIDLFLKGLV